MAYDRSRALSQSIMPLFDLFKESASRGKRGPTSEDQQQRHRARTRNQSWLRTLIGSASNGEGEDSEACVSKADKSHMLATDDDRNDKENGPARQPRAGALASRSGSAAVGHRGKASPHGPRDEERYFLSESYSIEDDTFIDIEADDSEEGDGACRPTKRAGSSRSPSHRIAPPLPPSLPLPPDPSPSNMIPTPTFRLVDRPYCPVALGRRAEALTSTESGSRARGKRRGSTTFRRKEVFGPRCRRRKTPGDSASMDDEAFARRHRPMEVAEKRILRREAELGRYRAYMAELRVNSPELWSRRIT